jgi:serine/threonine protein phosphatase 1
VPLSSLLRPRSRRPATAPGERIYAIGDVHGCLHLLSELLDRIAEHDAKLRPAESTSVLLLGDVVDRGPDSAGVLGFVRERQLAGDDLVMLLGNHEELLLRSAEGDPDMLRAWMRLGGRDTLRSFGVEEVPEGARTAELAQLVARAVPHRWAEWLRDLPLTARSGDYFFCHAGIRPGVPLKRQTRRDLLWIREDFMDDTRDHGAVIVHGHTIVPRVEMLANRINLDTGAYRTGVLSALYLEGTTQALIQTGAR